ncbi:MAG: reductive dehalogenase [Deltaproteobacteria bacterium]|jgi:reductive dehalogenase|nr:reductive dehalogenase [Deltaproteobacteria bacterium]MBT4265848.1 reductive dehalogenase [Deltaproteobacteria bacterium]MBT4642849.1 reductive dehalogenase [Deltaproteobacteria bacterium]MBT6504137.1 reductive dehalogenase [Deltaproteobacteria bacterium]MBT6612150.1 reductive dehalogenase [Deltaproteobacteria bacterium]
MLMPFLITADLIFMGLAFVLLKESLKEQEKRATLFGISGVVLALLIGSLILFVPDIRTVLALILGTGAVICLLCLIPWKQNKHALAGTSGYVVDEVTRFHEADSVFARSRLTPMRSDVYEKYYQNRPEQEERDQIRRKKGILGNIGSIDGGYQSNVAVMISSDEIPDMLGIYADSKPSENCRPAKISTEKATQVIKGYSKKLGADMVGICKTNSNWVYSNRGEIFDGNWDNWGKEIADIPHYAIVFLLEMDHDQVQGAPHTPIASESTINYGKGTFISTILARWIAQMGYRGVAQHSRHYDVILPPLAVDAGLGEIGRNGYLIAPKYGARVRAFAVLTDMPLIPDKPISLGVEEFCKKCLKCADACPSRSIPTGEMTVSRGVRKWKLNEEACYDYWARVGTDCGICMAICPFSRPNNNFHKMIRWVVAYSPIAKALFPYIDNLIYGKKWRSRHVPDWISFPKRSEAEDFPKYSTDIKY